jgi:hypothetical protein
MQNSKVKQTLMIFTNNQSHITAYIKAGCNQKICTNQILRLVRRTLVLAGLSRKAEIAMVVALTEYT